MATSPLWAEVLVKGVVQQASNEVNAAIETGKEATHEKPKDNPIQSLDKLNEDLEQLRDELKEK